MPPTLDRRDAEPILPCWIFHDWDKWKVTDRSALIVRPRYIDEDSDKRRWPNIGTVITQERSCQKCGLTQVKETV